MDHVHPFSSIFYNYLKYHWHVNPPAGTDPLVPCDHSFVRSTQVSKLPCGRRILLGAAQELGVLAIHLVEMAD